MPTFIETLPASTTDFFVGLESMPFRSGARDAGNAWFCAEAAALAYKTSAFVRDFGARFQAEGWGVQVFEEDPTQAVLLTSGSAAVLTFRGTRLPGFPELLSQAPMNLRDLLTNLSFKLVRHPKGGKVHSGFLGAFSTFWNHHGKDILRAVDGRALYLAGHSLGAALAVLATHEIGNAVALYTFGCPRIGDTAFQKAFADSGIAAFRFVHGYDIVSTVPLLETGFEHIGEMIHIDLAGSLLARMPQPTLWDSLRHNVSVFPSGFVSTTRHVFTGRLADFPNFPLAEDALVSHAPINYTRKLRAAAELSRALPI